MHALQSFLERRSTLSIIIAVTVTVFFAFAVVNAATTISTDVVTGGGVNASSTLAVTGDANFYNGAVVFNEDGGDNDFRIEGDTVTNTFVVDAGLDAVGIGSTTPWGKFSVEAADMSGAVPVFVVGSNATATPLFIIEGNAGNVGIGTSSPSATPFSVVGDAYVSSGFGVGHVETTDGRLTVLTDAGIATTSPSATGLSVAGDGYFSSGFGVGHVETTDGRLTVLTDAGIGTTSASAVGLSVVGDGYFSSGFGVGHVETTDGRLTVLTDAGIGTTSASAVGLSVVGDGYFSSGFGVGHVETTDGRLTVLTDAGIATTSPAQELGVVGDAYFGSAATTTVFITSSAASTGGCIEMEGPDDKLYKVVINEAGTDVEVTAGTCQ